MKIYIHIANNSVTTDPAVMTTVECDGIPRPGDLFYITKETRKDLEDQARASGICEECYEEWFYGKDHNEFSFCDAIYIRLVSWEKSKEGTYRCHVELCDNHRIPVEK